MEESLVRLNGKITYILFHSEDTFYTVAKFRINDEKEKTITITGTLPDLKADVLYNIYGTYVEHPRYGMQFKVESYEKPLPSERDGIIRYLSGVQFPGIGKKTAEKIVSALGEDCLTLIREDIQVLYTVPGMSDKTVQTIKEGLEQENEGMEELVRFLNVHGIGIRNLVRLNQTYGKDALNRIKENPYRVIEECDGFGFATADKLGLSLGIAPDDSRRLYAMLVSCVMDLCMANGNSYIRLESLEEQYRKRAAGLEYDFAELLDIAVMHNQLVQEGNRIYPVSQHDAEVYSARFFDTFPERESDECDTDLMHKYLDALQKDIGIEYDERQKEAIDVFFSNPLMIMTGGPGTGKTTVVRALVSLYRMIYPSSTVVCAAPTGRAAKRLAELTGTDTATIHSLLQWDLESNTFGKNEDEPILADLLIVDEFSMVDAWLFYNLLRASHHVRKICIIGDEDQLPSVGPGSVLRDLIRSGRFPLIRLEHIYRQEEGSGVITLAHDINMGEVDPQGYSNVGFYEVKRSEIRNTVVGIVQEAMDRGYELEDIQVLSPMYNGAAGIDVLNNALQSCFNPQMPSVREVRVGYTVFREGDKILQLKNQPDDDVYNGDIGTLIEIINADESENHKTTIVVDFQGIIVEYNQDNWNNITLAYCISIHKAQGSEYPIVIMPFTHQMNIMLQRKLIYTGVSRARRSLIILGELSAFRKGIEILERHPRETTLCERLTGVIEY